MSNKSFSYIQEIVREFEQFYFRENLRGNRDSITFRSFIDKPEYDKERKKLESECNGKSLEELVLDNLSDDQRKRIGSLFHKPNREPIKTHIDKSAEIIDEEIVNTYEFQGYLNIRDLLSDAQKEKLAERLSAILYERLDDEKKKALSQESIKKYMLNIGFIQTNRYSHAKALDFMKTYASLFNDENEVLSYILERYVDEELTNTPINETNNRIKELKQEVKDLYRSLE